MVPRPFVPSVHGTSANDLFIFDYIEIAPSNSGDKYVLMWPDDHSDYKWFFCFSDTSAENSARAIIDWCAAFGVPNIFMSDGPTHFKNKTYRHTSCFRRSKTPSSFYASIFAVDQRCRGTSWEGGNSSILVDNVQVTDLT